MKTTKTRPTRAVSLPHRACAGRHGEAAFTMVEIALSLGIIAFALVAIIGVLPMALTVQRDNRLDTIIDQDGKYLLEQLRSGQVPLFLSNEVRVSESGVVAERGLGVNSVAFKYLYSTSAHPMTNPLPANASALMVAASDNLSSNLYELTVTMRWPVLIQGAPPSVQTNPLPSNRRIFRALASGNLYLSRTNQQVYFVRDLLLPVQTQQP